jgi:hypothetical protein
LPCRVCDPESNEPICTCPHGAGLSGLPPADYGDAELEPLPDEIAAMLADLTVEVVEDSNVFSLLDRLPQHDDERPAAA